MLYMWLHKGSTTILASAMGKPSLEVLFGQILFLIFLILTMVGSQFKSGKLYRYSGSISNFSNSFIKILICIENFPDFQQP